MADIKRKITGSVDLPTLQTRVAGPGPAPESPVLGAVGQLAGAATEFAQAYKTAEFNFQATEAETEIAAAINQYQTNLRTNPILREPGDADDIITKKEKDWLKFSESIQKDIIGNIGNDRLRNQLTQSWEGRTEDIRNRVANNALDENMVYMTNRLNDTISEGTANILEFSRQARDAAAAGDIETANNLELAAVLAAENVEKALVRSAASALTTEEQAEDAMDVVDRYEALGHTYLEGMSFSESKQFINESTLTTENKAEAHKVLKANEDERLRVEKEQLEATQEINMEEGFLGISQDQITTMPELDAMLSDGGRYAANDSGQGERLRAALRRRQKEREPGKQPEDDPAAIQQIDEALLDPRLTREEYLKVLTDNGDLIKSSTYLKYFGYADEQAFTFKNEQAIDNLETSIDAMIKQNFWGKDPIDQLNGANEMRAAARDLQFSKGLTAEQISTEQGFTLEDSKQLVANFQDEIVGNLLRDQPIREDDGKFHWTDVEKVVQLGLEGKLYGRTNVDQLSNFLTDPTMSTATLQNNVAKDIYGRSSYDNLTSDQKNTVDITVMTGQLVRKAEDVFKLDYPGVDAIMGIEVQSNLPTARTAENLYRLEIAGKEEKWKVWDIRVGAYVDDPAVVLPETRTTPNLIRDWNNLQKLLETTPDPTIEPLLRRDGDVGRRIGVNDEIIPQGNARTPSRGRTRGIGQ